MHLRKSSNTLAQLSGKDATQEILKTKPQYPGANFTDMYDANFRPNPLLKAHLANDAAVNVS